MNTYVCQFSGDDFGALKGRQRRDYDTVRAAVLADGRFSAFDATATAALARIFDRLCADPEIETTTDCYPWIGVRMRGVAQ